MKSMKPLTADEAFSRLAAACARRELAPADVRQKLLRLGLTAGAAQDVLNRLTGEGYVDERRYARAFVNDRTRYDRWGRLKTRQALAAHGIPRHVADEALADIDEKDYEAGLRALLATKERSLRTEDEKERRLKLMRFAAGRGFEPAIVYRCLGTDDSGDF